MLPLTCLLLIFDSPFILSKAQLRSTTSCNLCNFAYFPATFNPLEATISHMEIYHSSISKHYPTTLISLRNGSLISFNLAMDDVSHSFQFWKVRDSFHKTSFYNINLPFIQYCIYTFSFPHSTQLNWNSSCEKNNSTFLYIRKQDKNFAS